MATPPQRRRPRVRLAAEARALMKNGSYVREARKVAALMQRLRSPL